MTDKILAKYTPTIGIECHVQLNTKTKLFARVSNDARMAEPNTTVSPICFGLPGVLPVLNRQALNLAVRAGIALNARIANFSKFDRKHYFYPDLPLGYQITQYDQPIVGEGYVEIANGDDTVRVGIERAHLEADAGKLTHPVGADYSLVDLNRVGTPLLEIVSKPDITSPKIAKAYAHELYLLMKYAEVSDVDLFHGHMRFDVNISVAKTDTTALGTRVEIKNLNSFRAVEKAAQYEFDRQVNLLEQGEPVSQETRGWDEDNQTTFSQRGKEEAHDYRYFPDPDLPPVILTEDDINQIRRTMPTTPQEYREKLQNIAHGGEVIDILLDLDLAKLLFEVYQSKWAGVAEKVVSWLISDLPNLEKNGLGNRNNLNKDNLGYLAEQVNTGRISHSASVQVFEALFTEGGEPDLLIDKLGLTQISDTVELEKFVETVIAKYPEPVADVRSGEMKAVGFLVGKVMSLSQGRANPQMVHSIILRKLGL